MLFATVSEKRNGVWLTTARGYASYRVVTSSEEYHENGYHLADVEMTLNERQQGTFAGTIGPQIPSI